MVWSFHSWNYWERKWHYQKRLENYLVEVRNKFINPPKVPLFYVNPFSLSLDFNLHMKWALRWFGEDVDYEIG